MSRLTSGIRLSTVLAFLVLGSSRTVNSQVLYGSLTGNVTDPSGAAIPDVKVEALNTSTGVSRVANTDNGGSYSFNDLQPGIYRITYSAASFRTVVQENVQITTNNLRRLDMQLAVAQVSEAITVSGTAVALQTDRADVNVQIQQAQITNLPFTGNSGRNWQGALQGGPRFLSAR